MLRSQSGNAPSKTLHACTCPMTGLYTCLCMFISSKFMRLEAGPRTILKINVKMVVTQASGGVKTRPQTAVRGENPARRRGENPSWTTRSQASGEVITQPQTAREVKTPLDLYKVVGRQVAREARYRPRCEVKTRHAGEVKTQPVLRGRRQVEEVKTQSTDRERGENPTRPHIR